MLKSISPGLILVVAMTLGSSKMAFPQMEPLSLRGIKQSESLPLLAMPPLKVVVLPQTSANTDCRLILS
jgi:hypothetical protein